MRGARPPKKGRFLEKRRAVAGEAELPRIASGLPIRRTHDPDHDGTGAPHNGLASTPEGVVRSSQAFPAECECPFERCIDRPAILGS